MSFVPGMTGLGSANKAAVRAPLTSVIKFKHSVSANTDSVAWPTGIRAGDLALLYDWCYVLNDSNNPSLVVPQGFSSFHQGTGPSGELNAPSNFGRTRLNISYKILTGTEPEEVSLVGMSGNRGEAKVLMLFRGNVRIRSVTPKSMNTFIDFSNPPAQSITSSAAVTPAIVYGFTSRNVNGQTFTTNSPAFSEIVDAGYGSVGGYRIYNSAPVNHSVDGHSGAGGTDSYGIALASGYLELA